MVKLSIITPYYKTYDLTIKLLEGLIPQLTDEVEMFLVDDGCDEKRLDKYSKDINIIHMEENVGATICMNKAIRKAVGTYIAIVDSDDLVTKDYIETLLKTIDERNEDVIYFDWQDMNNGIIVHHPHNYAPWKAIYKKSIMPLFRDGWKYSYDVPFQQDLAKLEHTSYYIDKVLYLYNSNREGSLTMEKDFENKRKEKSMHGVEVVEDFSFGDFKKIEDSLVRKNKAKNKQGRLYVGDTFKCDRETLFYLSDKNPYGRAFVKLTEVAKEEITETEEPKTEPKVEKKKTRKKK